METQRDDELGAALARVYGRAPESDVDWEELRAGIVARTALVVPKRRSLRGRWGAVAGTAAAASLALLWLSARGPLQEPRAGGGAPPAVMTAGLASVEEILGADVSDAELRALLAGAGDVEALLLLAASESDGELQPAARPGNR